MLMLNSATAFSPDMPSKLSTNSSTRVCKSASGPSKDQKFSFHTSFILEMRAAILSAHACTPMQLAAISCCKSTKRDSHLPPKHVRGRFASV
jgi:hypothetical protein